MNLQDVKFDTERYDEQKEIVEINRRKMWQLKQQPCSDCKLRWHPYCMTFDHVNRESMKLTKAGRPININKITYWQPKYFDMQLERMDVVCSNCHMVREAKRDINDPKVRQVMKHAFKEWFTKCRGALYVDKD